MLVMKYLLNFMILILISVTLVVIISFCSIPLNCQKYINILSKPTKVDTIIDACFSTCRTSKNQKYKCNPYICYKKITQFVEINNTRYCNYIEISSDINTLSTYSNNSVYSVFYNTTNSCFFQQNKNLHQCDYINNIFIVSIYIFISIVLCFGTISCYIRCFGDSCCCCCNTKICELSDV
jgi:hypothetical protein